MSTRFWGAFALIVFVLVSMVGAQQMPTPLPVGTVGYLQRIFPAPSNKTWSMCGAYILTRKAPPGTPEAGLTQFRFMITGSDVSGRYFTEVTHLIRGEIMPPRIVPGIPRPTFQVLPPIKRSLIPRLEVTMSPQDRAMARCLDELDKFI